MKQYQLAVEKLERFRMCVSDIGFDPGGATLMQFSDGSWGIETAPHKIPNVVAWKANELAIIDQDAPPVCFRCAVHHAARRQPCRGTTCHASRYLELDCGAPR